MPVPLEGAVAIVTGSSRGIGRAIALKLAEDGSAVVVCARTEQSTEDNPGSIGETAERVRDSGGKALALRVDVTNDAELESLVDKTMAEFGKIDILVNNAGALGGASAFLGGDPALLDHFHRTNLRAPYVLSQIVGVKMAERRGGVIFNISSALARIPDPSTAQGGAQAQRHGGPGTVYGVTKAALDRFAAGVAPELREKNIAIINIYPGMTLTERISRMMPEVDTSWMERPETTAKAVAFLCRDPMPHTGRILTARAVVDQNEL
jgi:NAD(P)-dependent dehydrogenase (short-subunit alcohol dehydrogenase family)